MIGTRFSSNELIFLFQVASNSQFLGTFQWIATEKASSTLGKFRGVSERS